jgi:hypothetical protein
MSTELTLIGLTGRAGAGKDTAADYLCAEYGFVRASFAEPLKSMLEAMLEHANIDHIWLHEPGFKNEAIPGLAVSARELMQTLGTEWGRRLIHTDLWVQLLDRHLGIRAGHPVHDRIVITDVRFQNEGEWVRANGGHLLRLAREQAVAVRAHESEAHIEALMADTALHNDGSVQHLQDMLDGLMDSLGLVPRESLFREGC